MDSRIGDAQFAGNLGNWLPGCLYQSYCFLFEFFAVDLLDLSHMMDPFLICFEYISAFGTLSNWVNLTTRGAVSPPNPEAVQASHETPADESCEEDVS